MIHLQAHSFIYLFIYAAEFMAIRYGRDRMCGQVGCWLEGWMDTERRRRRTAGVQVVTVDFLTRVYVFGHFNNKVPGRCLG